MNPPEFPKDFYNHCPKVCSAKFLKQEEPESFAECAFRNAGIGKECENCGFFMTRPYTCHEVDREFLPKIEKFYKDLDEYEKYCKTVEESKQENGSGI